MRRSVFLILLQLLVIAVVAAIIFDVPLHLEGLFRKEGFYKGKPTVYWKHQLEKRGRDFQNAVTSFRKGGAEGVPVLVEILQTGNDAERQGAIAVLRGMGPAAENALPALHVMLDDRDAIVRLQAAEAIFVLSKETYEIVPVVLMALRDDRDDVCRQAAELLGQIGPTSETSVPALIASLKDEKPRVRAWAAAALSKMGPAANDAVPALEAACLDTDPQVSSAAVAALRQIRNKNVEGITPSPFGP